MTRIAIAFLLSVAVFFPVAATEAEGRWRLTSGENDEELIINFEPCGDRFCAVIEHAEGPELDRPVVGHILIKNLRMMGEGLYEDGRFQFPGMDRSVPASFSVHSDQRTATLKVCRVLMCQRMTWTRP